MEEHDYIKGIFGDNPPYKILEDWYKDTLSRISKDRPDLLEELLKGRKVFEISIPNFTNRVLIAHKMQLKPYIKGRATPKLPAKYKTADYDYGADKKLYHVPTGEVVASNPTKVGQPRFWEVNGQHIYNGAISEHARDTYIDKLKDFVRPYIEETPFVNERILQMELRFFVTDRMNKNIDNDNKWIWEKCLGDVMKKLIIPEDDPKILYSHLKSTYFVEEDYDTRLDIILWAKD